MNYFINHRVLAFTKRLCVASIFATQIGVVSSQTAQPISQMMPAESKSIALPPLPQKIVTGVPPDEFVQAVNAQAPLSPDQIRLLRKSLDEVKKASSARVGLAPRAVSSAVALTLAPGASPHVLRLAPDFVTTVVFMDASGAPWNISEIAVGNISAFTLSEAKKTNTLTISPKEDYSSGNISVKLEGASAPISMSIVTGQKDVDYILHVNIQARGPSANVASIDPGFTDSVPKELVSMLDGVTPSGAKILSVVGGDAKAWKIGDRIVLRSRMNLLSPGAIKVARSTDGTAVYEIKEAPAVLMMNSGRVVELSISGF